MSGSVRSRRGVSPNPPRPIASAATIPSKPASVSAEDLQPQPITVLSSQPAQIYTHVHPFLILSIYLASFSTIVADPVPALQTLLLPIAGLQLLYVTLCLPATGEGSKSTSDARGGNRWAKKRKDGSVELPLTARVWPAILSLLLSTLLSPVLLVLTILFGAPLTTHFAHTSILALHISLLSLLPLIYVHGVTAAKWLRVASLWLPFDEVFGAALGTWVGAWCGAVPIPLDWDREWQKWPVTIVTGAYIGWAVGKYVGIGLKGWALPMD